MRKLLTVVKNELIDLFSQTQCDHKERLEAPIVKDVVAIRKYYMDEPRSNKKESLPINIKTRNT